MSAVSWFFQRPLWRNLLLHLPAPGGCQHTWACGQQSWSVSSACLPSLCVSVCLNLPLLTEGQQSLAVGPTLIPHDLFLTWFREEPGGLQSTGLQRVGHDWSTNTFTSAWPHLNLITLAKIQFPKKVTVTGSSWTWIWRNTVQLSTDVELFHLNPGVEKLEKRLSVALL